MISVSIEQLQIEDLRENLNNIVKSLNDVNETLTLPSFAIHIYENLKKLEIMLHSNDYRAFVANFIDAGGIELLYSLVEVLPNSPLQHKDVEHLAAGVWGCLLRCLARLCRLRQSTFASELTHPNREQQSNWTTVSDVFVDSLTRCPLLTSNMEYLRDFLVVLNAILEECPSIISAIERNFGPNQVYEHLERLTASLKTIGRSRSLPQNQVLMTSPATMCCPDQCLNNGPGTEVLLISECIASLLHWAAGVLAVFEATGRLEEALSRYWRPDLFSHLLKVISRGRTNLREEHECMPPALISREDSVTTKYPFGWSSLKLRSSRSSAHSSTGTASYPVGGGGEGLAGPTVSLEFQDLTRSPSKSSGWEVGTLPSPESTSNLWHLSTASEEPSPLQDSQICQGLLSLQQRYLAFLGTRLNRPANMSLLRHPRKEFLQTPGQLGFDCFSALVLDWQNSPASTHNLMDIPSRQQANHLLGSTPRTPACIPYFEGLLSIENAVSCIVVMLADVLGVSQPPEDTYTFSPTVYERTDFIPLLFQHASRGDFAFIDIFLAVFDKFYATWVELSAESTDLKRLVSVLREQVIRALSTLPSTIDEFKLSLARFPAEAVRNLFIKEQANIREAMEKTYPLISELRRELVEHHTKSVSAQRLNVMILFNPVEYTVSKGFGLFKDNQHLQVSLFSDHKSLIFRDQFGNTVEKWPLSIILRVAPGNDEKKVKHPDRTIIAYLDERESTELEEAQSGGGTASRARGNRVSFLAPNESTCSAWLDGFYALGKYHRVSERYSEDLKQLVELEMRVRLVALSQVSIPSIAPQMPTSLPDLSDLDF